jgi:hypothetical protein
MELSSSFDSPPVVQLLKIFPAFNGTPNVHYRVHNSPPLVPTLRQVNPAHTKQSYLSKSHFNIIHTPVCLS